ASYNTASTNVVLVVTRQSLVVNAVAVSKIYGSPNPAFSLQYHGFVNGDSQTNLGGNIQFTTTATQTSHPGVYSVIPSGLTSTNYLFTYVSATMTITPATLTVTANNAGRVYGASNPAFTSQITGFVNGESLATSDVTGVPALGTSAVSG